MVELERKPYEISIWEDRLVTENDKSYYKEIKIAEIGSDTMTNPGRAFDPILTENVNGEKTLTFSLAYKYFDPMVGDVVINPIHKYLINERKVKLHFNDKWYEFVIKECDESDEEYIFTYTARELFVLELSRVGYNITLDQSLGNNQGTIVELGKKALGDTDWQIDEENSDLLQQYVQEPLYKFTVSGGNFNVVDTKTGEPVEIADNEIIYVFYSYIENKTIDNVQFIREEDKASFIIDDNNVIKSTNYRIIAPVQFNNDDIIISNNISLTNKEMYYEHQGYRLVYGALTTYDSIMDRSVDIYQAEYADGYKQIYHYVDYEYTTSDLVTSYVANGTNFEIFDDGTIQGWSAKTYKPVAEGATPTLQPIRLTSYPEIKSTKTLASLNDFAEIEKFMELKFAGAPSTDYYDNVYYNSGFNDNTSIIDHITAGEEFVLRERYYSSSQQHGTLTAGNPTDANQGIRAIVAKYELVDMNCYLDKAAADKNQVTKVNAYKVLSDGIILDFNEGFSESPNVINNGTFEGGNTENGYVRYMVDGVIQAPSTMYLYAEKDNENPTYYIWDSKEERYVVPNNYASYYATTAKAKISVSNEELSDPKTRIGIFLYTKDGSLVENYTYLSDIQITRCYRTSDNNIVTLGNIPTATSSKKDYFYLKPAANAKANEINTYESLEFLAQENGLEEDKIKPLFNEECEKVLSIKADHSNCFNILQSLCETFECWLDIRVEHDETGHIKLDKDLNPIKKIAFKEYAGKDNFAGFRKGINLDGISRNVESNEIVTKLIVDSVQSEYSDNGSIDIRNASSNPSGESYILNFSYYLNRGLITDVAACNKDVNDFYEQTKAINSSINEITEKRRKIEASLVKIGSSQNVYDALINEAKESYNKSIEEFYEATGYTYEEYVKNHNAEGAEKEDPDNLVENDTVNEIIGNIYAASMAINSYSGLLINLSEEYKKLDLESNGAREYAISVTSIPQIEEIETSQDTTQVVFDSYLSGVEFKLAGDSSEVTYHTSLNEKIFIITSNSPYKRIIFTHIPENYKLQYYIDNYAITVDTTGAIPFDIYDNKTNKSLNRHFKLIPDEEYAEKHLGYDKELEKLYEEKADVEKAFYKKYSRFIQEGNWSSQDYIDSELYYLDALQVGNTSAQPKVSYTINVLEVSELDNLENYNFNVGDKTFIEDEEFFGTKINVFNQSTLEEEEQTQSSLIVTSPYQEEVIVSQIEWHLDQPDANIITIQNYKTQFEDLFQRISATVQTVQYNEATYAKTSTILDQTTGLINGDLLVSSLNGKGGFGLTSNGTVQTTPDGLLIQDLANNLNQVRIVSTGLQISTDGGKTWATAISSSGISAENLTAGTINTQKIWLMDGDNPSFRWDKSGLNAYGLNKNSRGVYDLKTYVRFDKYGLYGIKNDEDYVASSLADVKEKAHFGITWDGFFIKNSYKDGGQVEITSDNDFRVLKANGIEKIKIGALEWQYGGRIYTDPTNLPSGAGAPSLYGIRIRNDAGEDVFKTGDDGNLTITGTIYAAAGSIGGMLVNDDVLSMNTIVLEPGNGIYSSVLSNSNDETSNMFHISDVDGTATFRYINALGGTLGNLTVYDTITVGATGAIESSNYSTENGWHIDNSRAVFNNATVRGEVNAGSGNFYGLVTVGRDSSNVNKPYIMIDGVNSLMRTSNYQDGAGYGWMINSDGDAVFNNITARGAIKTAVFEYAEIQAVGGIFLFRPSSTIKSAEINGNDLVVKVEKPMLFAKFTYTLSEDTTVVDSKTYYTKGDYGYSKVETPTGDPHENEYYEMNAQFQSWCKISNYTSNGAEPDINSILLNNGLVHVYRISNVDLTEAKITLENGAQFVSAVIQEDEEVADVLSGLEGGALVDMGRENGTSNYGIGVNSSDNTVNLPARAISLFETVIDPTKTIKVSYNYRGILGTLPTLPTSQVSSYYDNYLTGTQGIYTDNMYIGDKDQYLVFYTDNVGKKHLRISASDLVFSVDPDTGQEKTWEQRIEEIEIEGGAGQDAITVEVSSSAGDKILSGNGSNSIILTCIVIKGGATDITSRYNQFKWYKKDKTDTNVTTGWPRTTSAPTLTITPDEIDSKATFTCEVEVTEE